jgi:hypothetical protein
VGWRGYDPLPHYRDRFYRPSAEPSALPSRELEPQRGAAPRFTAYRAVVLLLNDKGVADDLGHDPNAVRRAFLSREAQQPYWLYHPFGGRPTCRSPHLAVRTRFERGPEAVPVDLPSGGERVRTMPTPRGAIPLQTGAGDLSGSLSKLADSRGHDPHTREGAIAFPMRAGRLTRLAVHNGTP